MLIVGSEPKYIFHLQHLRVYSWTLLARPHYKTQPTRANRENVRDDIQNDDELRMAKTGVIMNTVTC